MTHDEADADVEAGHEPILSLVEIIIITLYLAALDALEILLTFVGLDDFWILDLLATPVAIYLFFRGVSALRYAATLLLELIPYVGNLPLLTVGFLATVYLDRHPKLAAIAQKAAAAKGGGALGGGAAAHAGGTPGGGRMAAKEAGGAQKAPGMAGEGERGERPASFEGGARAEEPRPKEEKEKALEKTETGIYGMPPEPLSELERRSMFEETPGKEEATNVVPFRPREETPDKRVILNENEVDLKKPEAA